MSRNITKITTEMEIWDDEDEEDFLSLRIPHEEEEEEKEEWYSTDIWWKTSKCTKYEGIN